MIRKISVLALFMALFLVRSSYAYFEPNNKVGIHISAPSESDIQSACKLVNGNGGTWGYATVVLQINDLNHDKWQRMFDTFRECHIIPIVRVATEPVGENWRKATIDDVSKIADFLNVLNWPVKDRYISLFNEPNHCREWGGDCNPQEVAHISLSFAKKLKSKSVDFQVGLAGLDQIAPNGSHTMEESTYLRQMFTAEPDLSSSIDILVSHSYPNPHFTGSVLSTGKGSIKGYEWELSFFKTLGVEKDLPVFITETGWDQSKVGATKVSENFKTAFESIWMLDDRVRAVTPFDLHIGPPFCQFSWFHCDTGSFNGNFSTVEAIAKIAGDPPQRHKMSVVTTLPRELIEGSTYNFQIWLKNEGQSICDTRDGFELRIINATFDYALSDCYNSKPGSSWVSNFRFNPGDNLGNHTVRVGLFKNDKLVLPLFDWDIEILGKPNAQIHVPLSPSGETYEMQIFNKSQNIVFKRQNIRIVEGIGSVELIDGIVLDECYRVVLLKRGYLPVQRECVIFGKTETTIEFPIMLQIDRNGDGKFSFADLF